MNTVDCKVDNSVDGKITIANDKINFVASAPTSSSTIKNGDWSYDVIAVLQLMVSKKPPLTGVKIVFKIDDSNSDAKILTFTNPNDRAVFVETVERETKRLEAEANNNHAQQQEQQERENNNRNSTIKREGGGGNEDAADNSHDVDDDDEGDLISIKRKAWLNDDDMASQVFNLLSQVSAFTSQVTNNKSKNAKKETHNKNKTHADAADVVDQQDDDEDEDNNDDDDDDDDDDALLHQILLEEERKFFSDPERQQVASASVYDALNSIVDSKTKTLKPITQATASTIFKQIPHLATVYNRVVHSAEDEMLFWVSVVRRRLFFSRTKLDAELSECGPFLCPLGVKNKEQSSSMMKQENENNNDDDDDGKQEKWELDHQEQRPRHDQVREQNNINNTDIIGNDASTSSKSSSKNLSSGSNNNNSNNNKTKALVSELNFASGKLIDDLMMTMSKTKKNSKNMMKHHDDDDDDDDDFARHLQFGALSAAEKEQSIKMRHLLRRIRNQHDQNGLVEDDADEEDLHAVPANSASAQRNQMMKKNEKDVSDLNNQKLRQKLAEQLRSGSSPDLKNTTHYWETVFVGNASSSQNQQQQQQFLKKVNNEPSSQTSPSSKHHQKQTQDDVKPLISSSNQNKTRSVGTSSKFVHGRAAAYLLRVFWRKAKDVFVLKSSLTNKTATTTDMGSGKSSKERTTIATSHQLKDTKKKFDSGLSRLRGICQSLTKVLDQWKPDESEGNESEKKYWKDALSQIEEVVEIL